MYEKIKKWYKQGLWNRQMVENAYRKGVLTEKEADNILAQEV